MRKRELITAPTTIEDAYFAKAIWPVAGIDEAGRGPLAGPVVACAIILPHGVIIEGVNDSKKISIKRREKLAEIIKKLSICYAFGIIEPHEIDKINILQATLKAMSSAIDNLEIIPEIALVDGNARPQLSCKITCVVGGDSASHLIAAASILAKVERDRIMLELHKQYPHYGFDTHKGYGTIKHREAMKEHGLCPQHRESFCHGY